jgi:hypothetical protein
MSKAYMQSHRSFNVEPEVGPTPRCCFFNQSKSKNNKISKADLKKLNQNWNHNTLNKIEETFRTNNKTNVPEWLDGFQARVFQHASDLQERATEYQFQLYSAVKKLNKKPQRLASKQNTGTIKRYLTDI